MKHGRHRMRRDWLTEADQRGIQIGFWALIVGPLVFSLLPIWI